MHFLSLEYFSRGMLRYISKILDLKVSQEIGFFAEAYILATYIYLSK